MEFFWVFFFCCFRFVFCLFFPFVFFFDKNQETQFMTKKSNFKNLSPATSVPCTLPVTIDF